MTRSRALLVPVLFVAWFGWDLCPSLARSDRVKGARPFQSSAETVDLFRAVEQGMLSVRVIPRDSKQCRVFITNESDRSLNVQMPAALAAVPGLGQQFPNEIAQFPGADRPDSAMPQRLGVGNPFGQANALQAGPNQQGNPLLNGGNQPFFAPFCIAPEKVAQLKLPAVCLDYGRPEPRPAMQYRLVPLAATSQIRELSLVCCRLGSEQISQRVAQAAAWYFSEGRTWIEMEDMVVHRIARPDEPFFSRDEIEEAKELVEVLKAEGKARDRSVPADAALSTAY